MNYKEAIMELINSIDNEDDLIYLFTWIRLYTEDLQ